MPGIQRTRRKIGHRDSALGDDMLAFALSRQGKEGVLKKKTHLFRQYHPRYFKIVNHYLNYWHSAEDANDAETPSGSLDLMGILHNGTRTTGIELTDAKMTIRFASKGSKTSAEETMKLRAESAPDIADWAKWIKARIQYHIEMRAGESDDGEDSSVVDDFDEDDGDSAAPPPPRPSRTLLSLRTAPKPPFTSTPTSPSHAPGAAATTAGVAAGAAAGAGAGAAAAAAAAAPAVRLPPAPAPAPAARTPSSASPLPSSLSSGSVADLVNFVAAIGDDVVGDVVGGAGEMIADVHADVEAMHSAVSAAAESVADAARAAVAACSAPLSPLPGIKSRSSGPSSAMVADARSATAVEQGSMRLRKQGSSGGGSAGATLEQERMLAGSSATEVESGESSGAGTSSSAPAVAVGGGIIGRVVALLRRPFSINALTLLILVVVLLCVRFVLLLMPAVGADGHTPPTSAAADGEL